jgi:hypothetical protein
VKESTQLTVTSLLSLVFFSVHWADDIARGFETGDLSNYGGFVILFVWLFATLNLAGRRAGYALVLLASLMAAAVPILHMRGAGLARVAKSGDGGLLFVWTLVGLGVTGLYALVLAARGLRRSLRGQDADPPAAAPAGRH